MTLASYELAWTERAKCADQPSDVFYASRGGNPPDVHPALECCNSAGGCPVRRHCLAYALHNTEQDGTWGGMLFRARRNLVNTRCPRCRALVGRSTIAAMVLAARQHVHCARCGTWIEVRPPWDHPRRNGHVAGTRGRT
jgi:WhiB family redox-sensing transcriptional regulator